ncbi:hypothetical protein [Mesorhizobium sp. WSM4884]|nr:hypothetical protein [Mesorhizobium sp. WSM4884]MDG4880943.1 hypothetical protein [Mesorhizobium sp. WSM4884]
MRKIKNLMHAAQKYAAVLGQRHASNKDLKRVAGIRFSAPRFSVRGRNV